MDSIKTPEDQKLLSTFPRPDLQGSNLFVLSFICLALSAILLLSCSNTSRPDRSVEFVVLLKAPAIGQKVYLSGNTTQLGDWNAAAVPMTPKSDSLWTARHSFPKGEKIDFKVTAGSWWSEALNKDGRTYDNFRLKVESDTVVHITVYGWLNKMLNGRLVLTAERFLPQRQPLRLNGLWRYHPGDNAAWAMPAFDDSSWVVTDPFIRWTEPSQPRWDGTGWFRFHMYVDSSLWNRTLAFRISQLGASRIYYNGRLLYSFGKIDSSAATNEPDAGSGWRQIRIDPRYDQLIAVRYANYHWKKQSELGYDPGFLITLASLAHAFRTAGMVRSTTAHQMVFTLIPLVLAFLHFTLYGFFRKQRQNLFYAICMLGFAGITYFHYEPDFIGSVTTVILFTKLNYFSITVAVFFGLLTVYEMNYTKLPKRTWGFLVLFIVLSLAIASGFSINFVLALNYVFFGLTLLEVIFSSLRQNTRQLRGGGLLLAGFLTMAVFIILQILVDYSVIGSVFGARQVYVYGMMSLAVSMSVFLSYNFAYVNKDLEVQLVNVRQLSRKTIAQERHAHKLELERQAIALENDRKNKELEAARELQLSLLPREVPDIEGLDIAVFMETATEVGGDYYDFFRSDDGNLMVAIGDATGHGLKAGNMVTATKGLLNILSETREVKDILVSANRAIKQMKLHRLTMCLAIARINGKTLRYSSAGMPPLLIYRAQTGQCEQVILKAMPLGAVSDFPYASDSITLSPGDVVVMTSDGLHELFDEKRETYGTENVMKSLEQHANKPAREIIRGLYEDGKSWAGNTPLADDLTMVVIKVTEELRLESE
ncbi:MAG: SpoIIE family protein phosphatase [Calditrichia bacterium]